MALAGNLAALVGHQSELDLIVPAAPPSLEVEVEPTDAERTEAAHPESPAREPELQTDEMSKEDFIRALKAI